jgi:hypothetical protein
MRGNPERRSALRATIRISIEHRTDCNGAGNISTFALVAIDSGHHWQ